MTEPLPLAAASRRLRDVLGFPRRVGRPRKPPANGDSRGDSGAGASQPPSAQEQNAPLQSALASQATAQEPKKPSPGDVATLWPRLLNLAGACRYLSLGQDVVLELHRAGLLPRVHIPAPVTDRRQGGEIRRLLFDRLELDRQIEAWRDRP